MVISLRLQAYCISAPILFVSLCIVSLQGVGEAPCALLFWMSNQVMLPLLTPPLKPDS